MHPASQGASCVATSTLVPVIGLPIRAMGPGGHVRPPDTAVS